MTCSIEGCAKPRYAKNGYCQMHNWRLQTHGNPFYQRPTVLCIVDGCGRKHSGNGLCALHRRRRARGLPLDYVRPRLPPKRYRLLKRKTHPLADKLGRVYEHRLALFDSMVATKAIGAGGGGRIPCFWCGRPVEWLVTLFVDHLNFDRHDNRPENLVPSCNGCNAGRTSANPRIRTSIYAAGERVGT
jgi:hypothetical protein